MVAILALSFLVFHAIATRLQTMTIDPTFDRADELQLDSDERRTERRRQRVAAYHGRLNHIFNGSHYLLDANGSDLVTGENRFLPPPACTGHQVACAGPWTLAPHPSIPGRHVLVHRSGLGGPAAHLDVSSLLLPRDGRYGRAGLAGYGKSRDSHSPIANSIAAFGQGNLSVRVKTNRADEIGELGRSFNQMAERLERFIVSERRLLGDISHELRSPLARLKFAVKLARTSQDSKTAIDRIENDIDRIASLVSDIVEITFVEGDPALRGAETLQSPRSWTKWCATAPWKLRRADAASSSWAASMDR